MSLPKPSYTFTIPSVQDDTLLDCRLYHPTLKKKKASTATAVSAAIVAHPYAPLGGSQDDPVVGVTGSVLLKHGFIVGTFNFRGAGGSAGRTSWSAKPELADYVSFYGFMLAYLSGINVSQPTSEGLRPSTGTDCGILILGGYSYGSLIAKNLPSLQVVTDIFASPPAESAQAEITLRAQDLSREYLEKQLPVDHSTRGGNSLRASASLVVGGYESEANSKRMSRESSRRSLDLEGVRRSVDRMRNRPSKRASGRHDSSNCGTVEGSQALVIIPKVCFLLVSPLLAPITAFLSLSSKPKLSASLINRMEDPGTDQLLLHPGCCIFGQHDIFTSFKRLRKWSAKLQHDSQAHFSTYEIEPAGHFWQEEGAESGLRNSIEQWLYKLSL